MLLSFRSRYLVAHSWSAVHWGLQPIAGAGMVCVLSFLFRDNSLHSFLIVTFPASVPVRLFIAEFAAVLIGINLEYGSADFAKCAPRPLIVPRLVWVVSLVGVYAVALAVGSGRTGSTPATERNLLLFSALMLLGWLMLGGAAAWVPLAVYLLCALFFGQTEFGVGGQISWWAVALQAGSTVRSTIIVSALFAVGAAAYSLAPPFKRVRS